MRVGELNPQGAKHQRILSRQAGSEPFGKFSTLLDFSTAYKSSNLNRYDLICTVLSMELLQFYYSVPSDRGHSGAIKNGDKGDHVYRSLQRIVYFRCSTRNKSDKLRV